MDLLAITIIVALWGAGCVGYGLATYRSHQRELRQQLDKLEKMLGALGPRRLRHEEAADIENATAVLIEAELNLEILKARIQTAGDHLRCLRETNRKKGN